MNRNVWHTEHSVCFNPDVEVRQSTSLGVALLHVDEVSISNATDGTWVKVMLTVTEFQSELPPAARAALQRLRWSVEHRRVFVEDAEQEGVWAPLGSGSLDRIVGVLVDAARLCDASVMRALA